MIPHAATSMSVIGPVMVTLICSVCRVIPSLAALMSIVESVLVFTNHVVDMVWTVLRL